MAFDGAISATIRFSMASAGSPGESATVMATLPPLMWYVSNTRRKDRRWRYMEWPRRETFESECDRKKWRISLAIAS